MFQPTFLTLLSVFFFFFTLYVTAPIIAAYAAIALDFPAWLIGITIGAYGWAMVICRIPFGFLASMIGAKRLILIGLSAIMLGLLLPFVPLWPFVLLPVSRFLLGVGASVYVLYTVLYTSFFSEKDLSKATSRITFAYAFPQIMAVWLGGLASEKTGWLAPFALGIPAVVIAMILVFPLKETARGQDWIGKERWIEILNRKLIVFSVFAMVAFFVAMATLYGFTQIWAIELGASKQELGLILVAMLVPYTFFLLMANRVRTYMGAIATISVGMLLLGLSVILIPSSKNIPTVIVLQALGGVGLGLVFPTTMAESVRGVPRELKYEAMGIYQTIYALGFALGPTVAGFLAEKWGLVSVFWVMGTIAFASIGLAGLLAYQPKTQLPAIIQEGARDSSAPV